ncbi:MAG: PilW family protein, partial [Deltaproteobacteria bacterium]
MTLKQTLRHPRLSNQGVTLIELMIAMTIFLLVLGAIYSTFQSQHKSYLMQEEVAAMQQNMRAAMFYLTKEIRMAGCDPTGSGGSGIVTANSDSISFTEDVRGDFDPDVPVDDPNPDGDIDDPNEDITYNLDDSDGDGVDDELDRNNQTVAQNIDALDFVYLDADGNTTATLTDIRSVEITIVARTGRALRATKDNNLYKNQQGDTILG